MNPDKIHYGSIVGMSNKELQSTASYIIEELQKSRQENEIFHYKAVTPEAEKIHLSTAKTIGIGGGNGSSKTETALAECVMMATGIIPFSLRDKLKPEEKLRGPVSIRVVCESLTTVLHPIILPKLKWWVWTGIDTPGGKRGHWGWIPRYCLVNGSWEKSWSEKLRILRIINRDPSDLNRVLGESTIQFCSVDQDASDFASGDFHLILHDEPPTLAIWRENEARTMRVNGRMMLAMTWPDDPAIAVDWLFDEVYEPGCGAAKRDDVDWFNLYTTDNPHLDQDAVQRQSDKWTQEIRDVRIYGRPIRFSNRVHSLFTDQTQTWCFQCGKVTVVNHGKCACGSEDVTEFCHVIEDEPEYHWPTVFLLDPHPRKPHMMAWWQVTPGDDLYQVAEAEIEGDMPELKAMVDKVENDLRLNVTRRLVDPNMARSPSSTKRGVTWEDEFRAVGLNCDLADDSDVGRQRINEYLKPDPRTRVPRLRIRGVCQNTIIQFKRYMWDEYRRHIDRDMKQKPKDKYDDYPTMAKYLLNMEPTFNFVRSGAQIIRRMGSHNRHAQRKTYAASTSQWYRGIRP